MPRLLRLLAAAVLLIAVPCAAAETPGSVMARAEGHAPVKGGRADLAFQQALDEAFRESLLEALRFLAPNRQSAHDFETWQETVLSRAADFVGSYRITSQDEREGFLHLAVEVEIYRDKLARAARAAVPAPGSQPLRLVVLADPLPVADAAADEEIDAGAIAVALLEAEFARRGAVILSTPNRAPWRKPGGSAAPEAQDALAAEEGRRLQADAVLVARVERRAERAYDLTARMLAAGQPGALGSAQAGCAHPAPGGFAEIIGGCVREIAAALAPVSSRIPRAARSRAVPP